MLDVYTILILALFTGLGFSIGHYAVIHNDYRGWRMIGCYLGWAAMLFVVGIVAAAAVYFLNH